MQEDASRCKQMQANAGVCKRMQDKPRHTHLGGSPIPPPRSFPSISASFSGLRPHSACLVAWFCLVCLVCLACPPSPNNPKLLAFSFINARQISCNIFAPRRRHPSDVARHCRFVPWHGNSSLRLSNSCLSMRPTLLCSSFGPDRRRLGSFDPRECHRAHVFVSSSRLGSWRSVKICSHRLTHNTLV